MPLRSLTIAYRIGFAVAVLVAIAIQLSIHVGLGFSVVNFFDSFRNLAVIYMTVVGIVFVTLLRNVDLGSLRPWINALAHYVMPIVVVGDWLIDRPPHGLNGFQLLLAPAFPLVYLAYALVRGAAVGWYPYPFLNPAVGGYGAVAGYVLGILSVFLAAGWMVRARA